MRLQRGGEACRSGNVADYALYAGHGVNETSDEKCSLHPVYLPLPRKSSFLVVFLSHRGLGGDGKKSQRWVFNLFNISMSYSGLTRGLCWSGIVYDPRLANGVPEGSLKDPWHVYPIRTHSTADSLFLGVGKYGENMEYDDEEGCNCRPTQFGPWSSQNCELLSQAKRYITSNDNVSVVWGGCKMDSSQDRLHRFISL